jgi:hypothetical protein
MMVNVSNSMGRVAEPETLERAPIYEYNPGYIAGATQFSTRGYPDQTTAHTT